MNIRTLLLAATLATAPGLALSQGAPPAQNVRIQGVVSAIAGDSVTVRAADGKETKLGLAPNLSLVTTRVVAREEVKPGAFVATANLSTADGAGRSIELRMFEPGSKAGEGNRPMTQPGAQPNQMMTNATVTKVAFTAAGMELDVAYPGGVRHLVVPPDIPVIASIPVDPSALKVGANVVTNAAPGPDGTLRAARITLANPPG